MSIQPPERRLVTEATLPDRVDQALTDPDSPAHTSLLGTIDTEVSSLGVVTALAVRRIITSTNPDEPLTEGDLLLVYADASPVGKTYLFAFADGIAGWSEPWADGDWATAPDETALNRQVATTSGSGRRVLIRDDAPTSASSTVEVVARVRQATPTAAGLGGGVIVRGSGATGTEQGWAAFVTSSSVRLGRFRDGGWGQLGVEPFIATAGDWYWVRLRAEGSIISMRAWADTDPEPNEWLLTVDDGNIPGPGWVGIIAATNTSLNAWDRLGIAVGGPSAPTEA